MRQGIPHRSEGNIWKQSCWDTVRVNKEYKKSHFHLFFPCLTRDLFSEIWRAIYAGATEDTSVLDVDTSDPSSTFFPKSCMMHTRNCREREIEIISQRFMWSFLIVLKVWALSNSIDLLVGSWRHKWRGCRWWRSWQSRQAWLQPGGGRHSLGLQLQSRRRMYKDPSKRSRPRSWQPPFWTLPSLPSVWTQNPSAAGRPVGKKW